MTFQKKISGFSGLAMTATTVLILLSAPASAAVVSAGSHKASTEVHCIDGSEQRVNNWVRSCRLAKAQTFNRVTHWNGDRPPTTVSTPCAARLRATFDEYGYITSCQ
jgi:hypothetical protein